MSISVKLRTAAAGALSIALLVGGATSAFAAPGDALNPQSNGSKGSFYLWDAGSGDFADGNPARVYTRTEALISSASSTDVLAEINPSATRPVTGAIAFDQVWRFISDKNPAAVAGGTATWKASSVDAAAGPNGGTLVADMTLNAFDGVDALITGGGSYWYGIAYTTNAGVTTVGAVYREINITAVSGNYTVAPVEPGDPTDVTTTTTLAASLLSVEAGQPTTLTATVSSTPGASGNVEFFDGALSLGTQSLASGSTSKIVTVSTVGDHTFSAKYVSTTVGTNHFLASTSNDVTVAVRPLAPRLTPDAPSENALDASNKQLATYSSATDTAQLGPVVGAADGTKVHAFGYSTKGKPMYLGEYTVGGTVIVANVSGLPKGLLKVAAVDQLTNGVLAWGDFTKTTDGPSISKTINANVAVLEPTDGEFSITDLSGANVTLTNPTIVGGKSVVSGKLGDFQVTDLRQISKAGWNLSTAVTDFTKGTDTIDKSALGIDPKKVSQLGSGATEPALGTALVSGSAVYPWDFATLAAGGFSGYTKYNADLTFTAPAGKPAGTYSSTLTLTLISK